MKDIELFVFLFGLILFVCSCNENKGTVASSLKVEKLPAQNRVLAFEKRDGLMYVPTMDSVVKPKIYNEVEEPATIDTTSVDTYTFGRPLKLGDAKTIGQSRLRVQGGPDINVASGTSIQIIDPSPIPVGGEFFARVRVDGQTEGDLPLGNIMIELTKSEVVTVGYIPRREMFSTVMDSTQHSLEGDKPIKLRIVKDVAYNNLVVITKADTMIIDGSYLCGFFEKDHFDFFQAFGVEDGEISDFNHDGLIDARISYKHLSSFSYQGISTGPSNFYFTLVGNSLKPMFSYNVAEGEDIDYTENSVSFSDENGNSSKESLQKVQIETTENSVEVRMVLYKMIDYSYEEQSSQSVINLKIPFEKDLKTNSVPVYLDSSDSSVLMTQLTHGQQVVIRSIRYSPTSSNLTDHFWYKIDSPDGWINGKSLDFFRAK